METNKTNKLSVATILAFLTIEAIFLVLILWGPSKYTNVFEFSSIVIVFLFSIIFFAKSKNNILTEVALLFTMIADLFLEIVNPMIQTIAMTSFLIVQLCYFVRLLFELKTKKWQLINLIIRVAVVLIAEIITIVVLKDKFDYLSCVSICYFSNLLMNIVLAFVEFKKSPLFAFGLLLFLGCDIFIGLQCANGVYIDIPTTSTIYKIVFAPFNIAWLCYLPSQTLIAMSIANPHKKPFEFKLK